MNRPWRLAPRPRRLRSRLALAASAAVVLVTVGVCTAAFFVLRFKLYQQVDQNLAQSATLVAQQSRDDGPTVHRGECRFLGAPACAQTVPPDPADDPAQPYVLPVSPAGRGGAGGRRAPDDR
ncbi:hypothetical protein ACFWR9_09260 [Streptomyces sp. NPDC058534]|uniref:hypothetical protein n=1 Tax=Streptomyces sp. NPDC058534 TaxID=3346541 RepID=UPI0036540D28